MPVNGRTRKGSSHSWNFPSKKIGKRCMGKHHRPRACNSLQFGDSAKQNQYRRNGAGSSARYGAMRNMRRKNARTPRICAATARRSFAVLLHALQRSMGKSAASCDRKFAGCTMVSKPPQMASTKTTRLGAANASPLAL